MAGKFKLSPGMQVSYKKPYGHEIEAKLIKPLCRGWWTARRSDGHTVEVMAPWIIKTRAPEKITEVQGNLF